MFGERDFWQGSVTSGDSGKDSTERRTFTRYVKLLEERRRVPESVHKMVDDAHWRVLREKVVFETQSEAASVCQMFFDNVNIARAANVQPQIDWNALGAAKKCPARTKVLP